MANLTKGSPRRMTGYVRVSRIAGRSGESFISPALQREQIAGWAKLRGVEIVAWLEDLDVSGNAKAAERPGLASFMDALREGETDGIVVARLDRLSRLGVADALALVESIQEAGGSIAALDLGIDPTTPFGEFAMTLMLGLARMERRRISDSWDHAKSRATDRGVKIGPTPFGYRRLDDARLEPDPVYGPVVSEAFRLAAQQGLDAALAYLVEHGNGRAWTASTVRRFLTKRSYLGESNYGDLVNLEAHEPLVSRATWEAAQPEPASRRRPKATFPLSGLATCAACGNALVGARGGNDARRVYRCSAALASFKGKRCTSPTTVTAELLEDLVRSRAIDALEAHPGFTGDEDTAAALAGAEVALRARERALADLLADVDLRATLGADNFRSLARSTVEAVDDARAIYRDAARQAERQTWTPTPELLATAELQELGELLRGVIERVIVARGRTPLVSRVRIVPKGSPMQVGMAASQDT